jgi:hypothetical protein
VDEWKRILWANPAQGRQVLSHLLGVITIIEEIGATLTLEPLEGYDARDRRGKEHVPVSETRKTLGLVGRGQTRRTLHWSNRMASQSTPNWN